jgi:hypothetical protein
MSSSVDLAVNIVTKFKDAGMREAGDSTSKFQSGVSKAAKVSAVALGLLGAAAISSAKAAAEDQQAQALLAQTLKNTGATDAQIAATEDWITATSRATAVADDELRPALATLVRATGDVTKSQEAMNVALDVAAATGKPLKSVTDAMAKAYAGQTTSLGKLVPGMDKAILASGDMNKIMAELSRTTKGSAAAAAGSAAGKWKNFQIQMGEFQEEMGAILLPIMLKMGDALQKTAVWAQKNATTFQIIVGVVAAFAAAIIALNIALKAMALIQGITAMITAFGASTVATAIGVYALTAAEYAMAAATYVLGSPILIVVAVLALLAAAIYLAWKHSETFRTVVKAVWAAIVAAALAAWTKIKGVWDKILGAGKSVFAWIKSNWAYLVAGLLFGPFGVAVVAIVKNWDKIKATGRALLDWIKSAFQSAFQWIRQVVDNQVGNIREVLGRIRDTASSVADYVRSKFAAAFAAVASTASHVLSPIVSVMNTIKSAIDRVIGAVYALIGALSRIKVPSIKLPHIPGLGGLSAPVPAGAYAAAPGVSRAAYAPMASTAGGGITINVTGAIDPESTARQIKRVLVGHDRRIGLWSA